MLLYDVFFKVEYVVEIGWSKVDHKKNSELCAGDKDYGADSESLQVRDSKRQKSLGNEKIFREYKKIMSIEGTLPYLQKRWLLIINSKIKWLVVLLWK